MLSTSPFHCEEGKELKAEINGYTRRTRSIYASRKCA